MTGRFSSIASMTKRLCCSAREAETARSEAAISSLMSCRYPRKCTRSEMPARLALFRQSSRYRRSCSCSAPPQIRVSTSGTCLTASMRMSNPFSGDMRPAEISTVRCPHSPKRARAEQSVAADVKAGSSGSMQFGTLIIWERANQRASSTSACRVCTNTAATRERASKLSTETNQAGVASSRKSQTTTASCHGAAARLTRCPFVEYVYTSLIRESRMCLAKTAPECTRCRAKSADRTG